MEINGTVDNEKIFNFDSLGELSARGRCSYVVSHAKVHCIIDRRRLDSSVQELILKAVEARKFAYCPYSNFAVGAALRTTTGEIFTGCNIENGAHSPTICAERTAVCKAVSEGFKSFHSIAVVAYQEDYFTSPCGVCRQTLSEFTGNTDLPVYISKAVPARVLVTSVFQLLPHRFRSEKLMKK